MATIRSCLFIFFGLFFIYLFIYFFFAFSVILLIIYHYFFTNDYKVCIIITIIIS